MSMKLLVIVAVGLLMALGCVETTSVEAPEEVDAGSSFQVIVNTVLVEAEPGPYWGNLAILIPDTWSVDSVYCDGYGYSGPMVLEYGCWASYEYPPSFGYEWFQYDCPVMLYGNIGDTGSATVTIVTSDLLGTFQIAFLGAVMGMGEPHWEGDPCSCTVDIIPLNLCQCTWASIKSDY